MDMDEEVGLSDNDDIDETPLRTVMGGAFDELPGAPWKRLPIGNYGGFAIPALFGMANFTCDEVGEAACRIKDLQLTVRVIGMVEDRTARSVHVFHLIADEFEALMLFPADLSDMHLSFRGSRAAFEETAEMLRAMATSTATNDLPEAVH